MSRADPTKGPPSSLFLERQSQTSQKAPKAAPLCQVISARELVRQGGGRPTGAPPMGDGRCFQSVTASYGQPTHSYSKQPSAPSPDPGDILGHASG